MTFKHFTVVVLIFSYLQINAQDPARFTEEIKKFVEDDKDYSNENAIVFTGSSSVRFWLNVQEVYPDYKIINTGFGGSQMSDLLFYSKDLIIKYQPKQVFIYEGDNDIAYNKTSREILKDTKKLVKVLRKALPNTELVFISAKPSIARWNLKDEYLDFNKKLEKFCSRKSYLKFVDVWAPMMGEDGTVMKDIFIEDNLHMNAKGYQIWTDTVRPFLYKK